MKNAIKIREYIRQQLRDYAECFIERETGEVLETKLTEDVCNHFDLDPEDEEIWNDIMDLVMPIATGVMRANGALPLFGQACAGLINSMNSDGSVNR